jgi:hypothetical protein
MNSVSRLPSARLTAPQCANCRKEIINTNKIQLEVHAQTHDQKLWPKEKCWPNDFPGTA